MAISLWLDTDCAWWSVWCMKTHENCLHENVKHLNCVLELDEVCSHFVFLHIFHSCVFSQLWKCLSELTDVWKVPVFIQEFLLAWSFLGALMNHISCISFANIGKVDSYLLKEMPALLFPEFIQKLCQMSTRKKSVLGTFDLFLKRTKESL